MRIFIKNKRNYEATPAVVGRYNEIKEMSSKRKETAILNLDGDEYRITDVLFIGDWCHNKICDRYEKSGVKAHPSGEQCEYDYIYNCSKCDKKMWKRDGDYSKYKWQKVVCYEHSPIGHIPKSDDPTQRTRDMLIASLPEDATEEQIERANEMLRNVNKLRV